MGCLYTALPMRPRLMLRCFLLISATTRMTSPDAVLTPLLPRGFGTVRLTSQRPSPEIVQHLLEQLLPGIALGERDPDLAHAQPDLRGELEQLEPDRAALRLLEGRAPEADAPQTLQQDVGE